MIYKKLNDIPEFLAGDHTHLKEVLHPSNDNVQLDYSLAHAYLGIGEQSLSHQLFHSETYYFLEGKGEIVVNDKKQQVEKGDIVYVPPHADQFVINTGETTLSFLCIVSPPWSPDTETIDKG